jgi:hypothetical protein
MTEEEQQMVKCNICGIKLSASQVQQHELTASHELHKSMLEQELNAVRKENYENASSVVVAWEKSSP